VAAALDRDRKLLGGGVTYRFLHAGFAAAYGDDCRNERDALVENLPVRRERGIRRLQPAASAGHDGI
jgi:hypothetical protein